MSRELIIKEVANGFAVNEYGTVSAVPMDPFVFQSFEEMIKYLSEQFEYRHTTTLKHDGKGK